MAAKTSIGVSDTTEVINALSPRKRALFELLLEKRREKVSQRPPIYRRNNSGPCPLSFAQQRLWFIDQLEPTNSVYNLLFGVRLTGRLDLRALEQTFNEIIRRHEALRTSFRTVDGQAVQVISAAESLTLNIEDLSDTSPAESESKTQEVVQQEIQQPFNLSTGPLLRVRVLRTGAEEHVVLLTMHHIISDGWSKGVLIREVATLYQSFSRGEPSPLEELPIQYGDYAVWQREWLSGEVLDQQLRYWRKQLAGAPRVLELPADRPRPAVQSFRGTTEGLLLSKDLTEGLRELSRREGVTLFMTLLAAFQLLLHRYSGQEEIVVGTDVANRNRSETEELIGLFVNQLVLRTNLSGDPSFTELLERVREVCLGAYEHQDIPFEKIVEELQPERDLSYLPLFQVKFDLHTSQEALTLSGMAISPLGWVETRSAKLDLTLELVDSVRGLWGSLEYSTDLFEAATIIRMLEHFRILLESIVQDPESNISAFSFITEAERAELINNFNDSLEA